MTQHQSLLTFELLKKQAAKLRKRKKRLCSGEQRLTGERRPGQTTTYGAVTVALATENPWILTLFPVMFVGYNPH